MFGKMTRHHGKACAALALATAFLALGPAPARAQQETLQVPAAPAPPTTARPNAVPIDEHTAWLIGGRRLKLGLFSFDYGIVDRLSFGSNPVMWALKGFSSVLVPNVHFKGLLVHSPYVDISGQIAGYYVNLTHDVAHGHVIVVPATLFASVPIGSRLWLHLEGAYSWARGIGSGDVSKTDLAGTAVMRTAQVGAMIEVRLSRVVALFTRGRWQPYASPITFEGGGTLDPYTRVDASFEVRPTTPHPAMAVAGVALTWKHVGLIAGAGYGHYFVPGIDVALPYETVTPEGSLWVLF